MKAILPAAIATALLCTPVLSQAAVNIDPDCNVNVNGNLRIHEGNLDITTESGKNIRITPDYDVFVDGEFQNLSSDQQAYAEEYYRAINTAVPMTLDIAADGIAIASDAIAEVFGQLLGSDDPLVADTQSLFTDLEFQINERFYDDQGAIVLQGSDIEADGWVTQQWENEFESKVESIVEQAIGRIMVNIGTELIFGNEDAESMMSQLENFDTNFEARIEEKASALEFKAEQLCAILESADTAENALQASTYELDELDLIHIDKK